MRQNGTRGIDPPARRRALRSHPVVAPAELPAWRRVVTTTASVHTVHRLSGSAGIVAADRLHHDAPSRAVRMRDVLMHRGPDGAGLHADDYAALAHRRLSIVDLAGGHQPLSNEDRGIWLTFNGEI